MQDRTRVDQSTIGLWLDSHPGDLKRPDPTASGSATLLCTELLRLILKASDELPELRTNITRKCRYTIQLLVKKTIMDAHCSRTFL